MDQALPQSRPPTVEARAFRSVMPPLLRALPVQGRPPPLVSPVRRLPDSASARFERTIAGRAAPHRSPLVVLLPGGWREKFPALLRHQPASESKSGTAAADLVSLRPPGVLRRECDAPEIDRKRKVGAIALNRPQRQSGSDSLGATPPTSNFSPVARPLRRFHDC